MLYQVRLDRVMSGHVTTGSGQVKSRSNKNRIMSGHVMSWTGEVGSGQVRSGECQLWSGKVRSVQGLVM